MLVDDLYHIYPSLKYDYELSEYARGMDRELYFTKFVSDLRRRMDFAGINGDAFENLPSPTPKDR